jgi:hypothetical protein
MSKPFPGPQQPCTIGRVVEREPTIGPVKPDAEEYHPLSKGVHRIGSPVFHKEEYSLSCRIPSSVGIDWRAYDELLTPEP